MNLGTNKSSESNISPSDETSEIAEIDEYFFRIDFSHKGRKFKLIIDRLMALDKDDKGILNEFELRNQLNEIDRYVSPLLLAAKDILKYRKETERDFDIWYAEISEKIRSEIIEERMKLKEEKKVPATMFTGITKEDIKNRVLIDEKLRNKYIDFWEKIDDLEHKEEVLLGLRKDLHNRSFTLQTISDLMIQDQRREVARGIKEE